MKRMETIVRNFCPKLEPEHPKRIEKLLNILSLGDALKLFMILPRGTLNSSDLSSRSQLRPYMLDFVEDMRDKPIEMENSEILAFLMEQLSRPDGVSKLEETLQRKQEERIKFISERDKRNKNSLSLIQRRF